MWFLSALLAVFLVSTSADTLTCPNGFELLSTGSKCVKLFTDRATHADAAANCSSSGGHLISITNAIDNRAISDLAATSSTPFWVGIKCTVTNSPASCLWDDQSGNAGTYNAFASGYPVVEIGNCVYSPTTGSLVSKWISGDCNLALNFICEAAPTTPVTSTCDFQYNGYCYYPTLSSLTEPEAEYACEQNCANLVSIHSSAENNYVQSLIGANAPTYIRIGAKTDSLGQNSWVDGSAYDYANVGYASLNLGMCWSMALRDDIVPAGKWISSKCDTPVPFICKKKFGVTCGTTAGPTLAPGQCTSPFFYDYSGTFYSPNWPYTYIGEANPCSYVLDTPVGTLAQIQFPVMTLDNQASIAVYSRIEDTTPLVVLTGNSASNNWYSSTTNTMKVIFRPCTSNCATTGGPYRWQANFQPSNQVTTLVPPVTVTPDPNNPSGCNSTILVAPGSITSPNYPNLYPNYLNCMYHLSTTGGYRIRLDFGAIETEACCDNIVVHDGPFLSSPELGRISGNFQAHVKKFTSSSNQMLVTFSTDASGQGSGFSATFTNNF